MPTTDGYNGAYTGPEIDAGIARANQAITVENSGEVSMSETLGSGPYTIEFTEEAGSGGGSLPDGSAGQILGYVEDNVVGPIMSKSDLLSDETAEIYNQLPLSWKIGTLGTTAVCEGVAYGNGMFVAISRADTIGAFVSTDGITWMHVAFPVTFDARAVAFGAGKFVPITLFFTVMMAFIGLRRRIQEQGLLKIYVTEAIDLYRLPLLQVLLPQILYIA